MSQSTSTTSDSSHKGKWWASMITIHGSEEAVRDFMRQSNQMSAKNKGGTGGFHKMSKEDPERFKKIASEGGKRSRR